MAYYSLSSLIFARGRSLGVTLLAALSLTIPVHAQDTSSKPEIKVGMSTALSGPSQIIGQSMRRGVERYFSLVNSQGGLEGRKLVLYCLDDGYEPTRTGPNVRKLIDETGVFAILGNVGTPTATVSVPIANEKKVPFFCAYSGAGILRKSPPDRYVVNFRASYAEETAEMVRGFVKEMGIKPNEIGFFTQNDAYGDSGYQGGVKALKALGYKDADKAPHGYFPRNTEDVESGLSHLMDPKVKVKAVIMVGVYKPCAKFILLAQRLGLRAVFANVSFVGSNPLAAKLGEAGNGVVVTQVVPHYSEHLPLLTQYHQCLLPEEVNFVSLEGFIAAKAFVESLKMAGANASREDLLKILESGRTLDLGLGGLFSLSPVEHQLSHRVWPTYIWGGHFYPLKRWADLRHISELRGSKHG